MKKEKLEAAYLVRVSAEDAAALEGLAARLPMSRAAIIRVGLRMGLSALARDPTIIIRPAPAEPPNGTAVPERPPDAEIEKGSPRKPKKGR